MNALLTSKEFRDNPLDAIIQHIQQKPFQQVGLYESIAFLQTLLQIM